MRTRWNLGLPSKVVVSGGGRELRGCKIQSWSMCWIATYIDSFCLRPEQSYLLPKYFPRHNIQGGANFFPDPILVKILHIKITVVDPTTPAHWTTNDLIAGCRILFQMSFQLDCSLIFGMKEPFALVESHFGHIALLHLSGSNNISMCRQLLHSLCPPTLHLISLYSQ